MHCTERTCCSLNLSIFLEILSEHVAIFKCAWPGAEPVQLQSATVFAMWCYYVHYITMSPLATNLFFYGSNSASPSPSTYVARIYFAQFLHTSLWSHEKSFSAARRIPKIPIETRNSKDLRGRGSHFGKPLARLRDWKSKGILTPRPPWPVLQREERKMEGMSVNCEKCHAHTSQNSCLFEKWDAYRTTISIIFSDSFLSEFLQLLKRKFIRVLYNRIKARLKRIRAQGRHSHNDGFLTKSCENYEMYWNSKHNTSKRFSTTIPKPFHSKLS